MNSPSEDAGNPASIISTPSSANFLAICIFCSIVKSIPGACSPSLKVVSNILILLGVENTHTP